MPSSWHSHREGLGREGGCDFSPWQRAADWMRSQASGRSMAQNSWFGYFLLPGGQETVWSSSTIPLRALGIYHLNWPHHHPWVSPGCHFSKNILMCTWSPGRICLVDGADPWLCWEPLSTSWLVPLPDLRERSKIPAHYYIILIFSLKADSQD